VLNPKAIAQIAIPNIITVKINEGYSTIINA